MKTILYLGTDPTQFADQGHLLHYPIIKIVPRSPQDPAIQRAFADLEEYTHYIFTSKHAVKVFFDHLAALKKEFPKSCLIAIGKSTASALEARGFPPQLIADDATQEGVIKTLRLLELDEAFIFMPRSSLARPHIAYFLAQRGVRHCAVDLYDTEPQKVDPLPDLKTIDEIVFTSPSTVEAFLKIYRTLPKNKSLVAIGPVTKEALKSRICTNS